MFMIEDVTSRNFPKEGIHMPFRPNPTKKPLIPPTQASSPPRADLTPQQQAGTAEPVRLVEVTRGSAPPDSMKNLPPPSRKCVGSFLACVALTMILRQGYMRREKPARSCKRI
jgi:hypothetical protein